jgi:hypothetical protein
MPVRIHGISVTDSWYQNYAGISAEDSVASVVPPAYHALVYDEVSKDAKGTMESAVSPLFGRMAENSREFFLRKEGCNAVILRNQEVWKFFFFFCKIFFREECLRVVCLEEKRFFN